MIRASLALSVICAAPLAAQTPCAALTDWAGQAGPMQTAVAAPDGVETGAAEAAECGRSMTMAGVASVHCAWGFPFRDAAGVAAFDALSAKLAACFAPLKLPKKQVNHPDSYHLQHFKIEGGSITLSLKDKGALQQSFVFLRAAVRP